MRIDISNSWKYIDGTVLDDIAIPAEAADVDLPLDLLRRKNRNYNTALGKSGSYYDACAATFYRELPATGKCGRVVLEVEGVCQFADVSVNGITAAHLTGAGKHFVDITLYLKSAQKNILKLCVWAPQMAGRYVGAGISGGIRIHTHATAAAFNDDGVFVSSKFENGKAHVTVHSEITDKSGEYTGKKNLSLEAVIYNARGKKTARKVKKIKLKNVDINHCELTFRLSRYYTWTVDDPYLYSLKLRILDGDGNALDETETTFGIVTRALTLARGLVLCGRGIKLKGAVMQHDNGILGMESTPSAEEYKLGKIKEIGYNAVRYVGCPSEAALDALDKIGLMAYVDLFGVWSQGEYPYDGHVNFDGNMVFDCERFVCQLRKHPSVVLYGLCDCVAETYGRGDAIGTADFLAGEVKALDGTRPVVINARELVPLKEELEAAGIKNPKVTDAATAISLGREKDLFGNLTAMIFGYADIAGYSYLYPRYASDRTEFPDRLILGCAAYPSRAYEAFEECEKNSNVVGEFMYCGADYLGAPLGKPEYEDEQLKLLPPHTSYCGDINLIYDFKPAAYYRSIMLGNRSQSLITVSNPELKQKADKAGYSVKETHAVWNWPHNLGKTMEVQVYSGGEVVALYRDGKLIGRKLAGKVNKHIATFKTEYYPGKLEAVSFHKGRECSRATLESVTAPRKVILSAVKKSCVEGGLLFVEVAVADKEGRVVPYSSREVEITVSGAGELRALGSADPESQTRTDLTCVCPVYEGKALAVIKTFADDEGKITVKATSDGLLSGKINLRVKPAK